MEVDPTHVAKLPAEPLIMEPQLTKYFDEFLRYYELAKVQMAECNLGQVPHELSSVDDDLMRHVKLYDVVERKYAGFTQVLLDIWYGYHKSHPYRNQFHETRLPICLNFRGWRQKQDLNTMLYLFMVHRLTGSGINYAKSPSGYHNTTLHLFHEGNSVEELAQIFFEAPSPKYTSVGYQFPAFPKPVPPYERGGDYFICEILPSLIRDFCDYLDRPPAKKTFRQLGSFLLNWNVIHGLRQYQFQYAAFLADLADFYPQFVDTWSPFYWGTNAVECVKYFGTVPGLSGDKERDALMDEAVKQTGGKPYNLEDVFCDTIRWIEHYVRPGHDYDHVDRDAIWSSSNIHDHPFGRQPGMLVLGLIDSFNDLSVHPSDDYVLKKAGWTVEKYQTEIKRMYSK